MWREIKIPLPQHVLDQVFPSSRGGTHSEDVRNITANLNELADFPLPNLFFNYDEKGRPRNDRAPVRFGSFDKGISVQGVGIDGAKLIESSGHIVRRLWSLAHRTALQEHHYSGKNAIGWAPRPTTYYIHKLVLDNPKGWMRDQPDAKNALMAVAEKAIKASLLREIDNLHGHDPQISGSDVLSEWDEIQFHVSSIESITLCMVNPGSANKAVMPAAKGVRFTSTVDLAGIWHLGRMGARGCGKVRRDFGNGRLGEHADPFKKEVNQ